METDKKPANYFFIGKDEVQDLGKESFAHFTARTRFRKKTCAARTSPSQGNDQVARWQNSVQVLA